MLETMFTDEEEDRLFKIFQVEYIDQVDEMLIEVEDFLGLNDMEVSYDKIAEIFMNRWDLELTEDDFNWLYSLDLEN